MTEWFSKWGRTQVHVTYLDHITSGGNSSFYVFWTKQARLSWPCLPSCSVKAISWVDSSRSLIWRRLYWLSPSPHPSRTVNSMTQGPCCPVHSVTRAKSVLGHGSYLVSIGGWNQCLPSPCAFFQNQMWTFIHSFFSIPCLPLNIRIATSMHRIIRRHISSYAP